MQEEELATVWKDQEAMEPYLTEEALKQVWHQCSTQKNEALNKWKL
jgi:hypothetical protein